MTWLISLPAVVLVTAGLVLALHAVTRWPVHAVHPHRVIEDDPECS